MRLLIHIVDGCLRLHPYCQTAFAPSPLSTRPFLGDFSTPLPTHPSTPPNPRAALHTALQPSCLPVPQTTAAPRPPTPQGQSGQGRDGGAQDHVRHEGHGRGVLHREGAKGSRCVRAGK
eukprot:6214702-Pleurochrysis_carterae.AAC.3